MERHPALEGHTACVNSCAFSSDGTRLVTASKDMPARVWGATTGALQTMPEGHADQVTSRAFSGDGTRVATASGDHTVRIWDATTGAL